MIGGNLIGRGSFGCVFKPELSVMALKKQRSEKMFRRYSLVKIV